MSDMTAAFNTQMKSPAPGASGWLSGLILDVALVLIITVISVIGAVFIIGDGPVVTGSLMMLAGLVSGCVVGPAFYAGLKRPGSYESLTMKHRKQRVAPATPGRTGKRPVLVIESPVPAQHPAPAAARRRQSGLRLLSSRPGSARHLEKRTAVKKPPAA